MTIEPKRLTPEQMEDMISDFDNPNENDLPGIAVYMCLQHIAYLQAELDTLKDAQPRVLRADYYKRLADYDNLKVCSVCGDKYTTASHGMCNSCYDQSIIDEIG